MTYDLALYPASGPGLGHLMRCMALAEWAVALKAKPVVCLQPGAPVLAWPCAVVSGGGDAEARVRIADGFPARDDAGYWFIVDAPPSTGPDVEGYIYPHFGAASADGFPTFVGPQWMPLRKVFSVAPISGHRRGSVGYRANLPGVTELTGLPSRNVADALGQAAEAIVPPSTIAYEAMAMGCPVRLLRVGFPGCEEIGQAMVEAGAASWYDDPRPGQPPLGMRAVNPRSAERLLEALL